MFRFWPVVAVRRHLAAVWLAVVAGACVSGYLFAATVVDAVPVPVIVRHPASQAPSRRAGFTYADRQRGAGFRCSLDGAPYAGCPHGGITYRDLAPGRHVFAVEAGRGRRFSSPARYAWRVIAPR